DTDDADAVVAGRGDRAGHVGAVPGAVRGPGPGPAVARGGPVARVGGVGVTAVAVVGDQRVGDDVEAGHQLTCELGVVLADASVEDGDDKTVAGGRSPEGGRLGGVAAGGPRRDGL